MATNDFLPFATAGGANVLPQSEWNALAARLSGYTAGVASSAQVNKGLRQGSVAAAMLGQFIVNRAGLDALDDGSVTNLLAAFEAAYRKQATNYVATVGGTANALTVTLDPAPAAWSDLAGAPLRLRITTTNTSTAVTFSPNGLAAKAVAYNDGSLPQPGDLIGIVEAAYNPTADVVQIVSFSRSASLNTKRSQITAERGSSSQLTGDNIITRVTNYGAITPAFQGGSSFAAGVLTIGPADGGLWFLSGYCRQEFSTASGQAVYLYRNNSIVLASDGGPAAGGAASKVHSNAARVVSLAAGDTVDMRLIQTTGADFTFNDLYSFSAVRIGA
ncbi:hypothetical protein [Bosea sp. TAF32]|uniref:hypothetical protein n=1 Tax=Bosea sp. TAF32 TaxID=3237482 RepID=UPI003F90567D